MNESWKDIKTYEGLYQISDLGRVKNIKTGRILKPCEEKKGYLRVDLYKATKSTHKKIHRLVAEAFIPNPENKPEINHKDGIKAHNEKYNLEWATSKENKQHSIRVLGNVTKGIAHNQAKLTEEQIYEIKRMLRAGKLLQKEIAKIFSIHVSTVNAIKTGRLWSHLL